MQQQPSGLGRRWSGGWSRSPIWRLAVGATVIVFSVSAGGCGTKGRTGSVPSGPRIVGSVQVELPGPAVPGRKPPVTVAVGTELLVHLPSAEWDPPDTSAPTVVKAVGHSIPGCATPCYAFVAQRPGTSVIGSENRSSEGKPGGAVMPAGGFVDVVVT